MTPGHAASVLPGYKLRLAQYKEQGHDELVAIQKRLIARLEKDIERGKDHAKRNTNKRR